MIPGTTRSSGKSCDPCGSVHAAWPLEKLIAYQKAREAVRTVHGVARSIPVHRRDLRSRLERAATSILLNIAEGANEFSLGDKSRFGRIARRWAGECDAALDALECAGVSGTSLAQARAELREVGVLLSALIHRPPPRE